MEVYVAIFGKSRYEWSECLKRNTVATPNGMEAFELWQKGDRQGYIRHRMADVGSSDEVTQRRQAAAWFNMTTRLNQSNGDIWLHKDGDELWWTRTSSAPAEQVLKTEPGGRQVVLLHKPCEPWRNTDEKGRPLVWSKLHAKARGFLNRMGAISRLQNGNEDYAQALIRGEDLSAWHNRPDWQKKVDWTPYDGLGKSVWRMADTAFNTAAHANGQQVSRTLKNKDFGFGSKIDLESYIKELLEDQGHLCAVSGLPLVYDDPTEDREMWASLDRIDSSGHYERGNLQVVCAFINRWKGTTEDREFRRLVEALRA